MPDAPHPDSLVHTPDGRLTRLELNLQAFLPLPWPWVAVTQTLDAYYLNGGTILQIFRPTSQAAFDTAWQSDRQGDEYWLRCFLVAPTVRRAARALRIPNPLPDLPEYRLYDGFEFEGAMTRLLRSGGAYSLAKVSEEEARRMSRDFVDALVGVERMQTEVWRIDEQWTKWFGGIIWDATFVIRQLKVRRCALFCVTDSCCGR